MTDSEVTAPGAMGALLVLDGDSESEEEEEEEEEFIRIQRIL